MCGMVLTGHGGPDKLVYRTDLQVPTPGPDDVLFEVAACGVNNTDIWTSEGAYGAEAMAKKFIGKLIIVPNAKWSEA